MTFNRDWFKGSVNVNTPFGWDTKTFSYGRMHPAQDYAPLNGHRLDTLARAVIDGPVSWLVDDGGNSVLRQYGDGIEVRYYHFRRDELSSDVIAALTVKGTVIKAGTVIGPSGNVGLSVAGNGNDGSHVHLVIVAFPAIYEAIESIMGDKLWHTDKLPEFKRKYGEAFIVSVAAKKISWMNDNVIARFDPLSQNNSYYLNPRIVLGV